MKYLGDDSGDRGVPPFKALVYDFSFKTAA